MNINKLMNAVKDSERFIFQSLNTGVSGIKGVGWLHKGPNADPLMWVKEYPGTMTIRPNGNTEDIEVYQSMNEDEWKMEYELWFDGKRSDLTVSICYNDNSKTITIIDVHVM